MITLNNFNIISSDNKLYFTNYTAATGHELWISEGTVASTTLLKNITTTTASSAGTTAPKLKVMNTLYFAATDGIHGNELWKTDGTTAGTTLVKDISAGPMGSRFVKMSSVNNILYFSAYTNDDATNLRLFRSDGTDTGTIELSMNDGTDTVFRPDDFIPTGQKMYVRGRLPFINDYSLWVIDDPVNGNPVRLSPSTGTITSVSEYAVAGEKLYFRNNRLWVTAGTNESTKTVFQSSSRYSGHNPRNLTSFGGKAFYTATFIENSTLYTGIFATDGTDIGTQKLHQFNDTFESFNREFGLRVAGNNLYFATDSARDSLNIWVSNGSVATTRFLKQLNSSRYYFSFKNIGDSLFIFGGKNYVRNDLELLFTNGKAAGTTKLLYLPKGASLGIVDTLGGQVYFSAYTKDHGYELWTSDGSNLGTYLVRDLRVGFRNTIIGDVASINNKLIFWAIDSPLNVEPWTYTPEPCEGNRNYTIQSGNWTDAASWSCGKVPTAADYVIIKNGHRITIPFDAKAESKFLTTELGSVLTVTTGSVLKTGN